MPDPIPTAHPDGDTDDGAFVPTRAELLAIVRATSDLVLVLDGEGRYVRVGPAAHDVLYRPASELLGRRLDEVFPPDVGARFVAAVRRALDERTTQELEYPLEIRGRTLWFRATVAPTGEGTVVWVARDVTVRRAGEQILRILADHSTDLVALHAPDGRYEYVSPSVARLLERTPDELVGTDPFALMHPDDVARVRRDAYDVVVVGRQPPPTTYRMRTASGEYVWFETLAQPVRDEGGAVVRLLTASRDVTERRVSEQALEAAALRDELTGVCNRRGFLGAAERALVRAQRHDGGVILVFVDLDDLKPINDRWGHEEGDRALRAAADALRATVRDGDVLGRIGGDEFALLLAPTTDASHALDAGPALERRFRERLAERVAEEEQRAHAAGRAWRLRLSAGVVVLPAVPSAVPAAHVLLDLMRDADRRLYEEKRARKTAEV